MMHGWPRRLRLATVLTLAPMMLGAAGAAQVEDVELEVPGAALEDILGVKRASEVYIVQLVEDPVVAYDGGVRGIPATKPAPGRKIDPQSRAVRAYVAHLTARHDAALNAVGGGEKIYDYAFTLNGLAAVLTPAQAGALLRVPGVVAVWADERRQPVTENSPAFLDLTDPTNGLWARGFRGENVVIGVIDTGIWPEHPSFSDQTDLTDRPGQSGKRTRAYGPPPPGWHGTCQSGELWSQDDCNNKLIGARYFLDGFGHHGIVFHDYKSARDSDGHGTHTASTAGGNSDVPANLLGVDRGMISGMAPRARIAAYKACWNDEGCFTSDLAMAIDQAVADGVDVINYSIGSAATTLGPDDVAFLFAADAGVFVATSAGNSGPGPETIGSPAWVPWVTTVGASTQDRTFQGSVVLDDSSELFGASVTGSTGMLPLVDSVDAGSEQCIPGDLDPGVVAGKIVLCRRGVIARVDKSLAVQSAGGLGMILYNTSDAETQNTDNHFVPSVHINNTDGMAIKTYISSVAEPMAQINGGMFIPITAPFMADFSSRGPNGGAVDVLKPDITAPGVNILAGNTPNPFIGAPGQLFQVISGTSMSSPYVAGVLALVKQAQPGWTPAMAKSALMTTAYQSGVMKEDGTTPADPFDMGGGHLNPDPSLDAGLTYDAGLLDYLGFLCGNNNLNPAICDLFGAPVIDPSDLNLPSIAIGDLAGIQTVQRTVHDVGGGGTYTAIVDPPPGIDVSVDPASFVVPMDGSASYATTFETTSSAVLDEWAFGSITWTDGDGHSVRSPIAVRPVALAAPEEVSGAGPSGTLSFDVVFGYSGAYTPGVHGLIPAVTEPDAVVDDPADDINTALGTGVGVTFHVVNIPGPPGDPATEYARFSLFDAYTDGEDDLDLYVFGPQSAGFPFVGGSGGPVSNEEVNLQGPAPGLYIVVVHGFETDGPDANYTLFHWELAAGAVTNMTVSDPGDAVLGSSASVEATWNGLDTGMKYLGSITHHDVASPTSYSGDLIGQTIVRIDTD